MSFYVNCLLDQLKQDLDINSIEGLKFSETERLVLIKIIHIVLESEVFLVNTQNWEIHPQTSFKVVIRVLLVIRVDFLIHNFEGIQSSLDLCPINMLSKLSGQFDFIYHLISIRVKINIFLLLLSFLIWNVQLKIVQNCILILFNLDILPCKNSLIIRV